MSEPRTAAGRALSMAHGDWLHNAVLDIEAEAREAALDEVRREVDIIECPHGGQFATGWYAALNAVLAILDRLRAPRPWRHPG